MDNRAQKSILKRTNLTPKGNQGALEQPPDYSPVGPSIVQKIQNAPDMDELLRLKNGSKKFSTNQVNPMYPQHQMSTYHSKNTLVDRATNLDESIEVKTQTRNYTRGATRTEYSDSSKKQLFSVDQPSKIYEEQYIENYIDKDLRKPKKKKFKNQDVLSFEFNQNLEPQGALDSRPTPQFQPSKQKEALDSTYALIRNQTQREKDFKYDTGFLFGKNFAKDERMLNLFKGQAINGESETQEAPQFLPTPSNTGQETTSDLDANSHFGNARKQSTKGLTHVSPRGRKISQKYQEAKNAPRPFEKWPTVQVLIDKARQLKKEAGGEQFDVHASSQTGTALEQILRKPYVPKNVIDHDEFMGQPGASLSSLIDQYTDTIAHCYEIKPKVDFSNTEIMYSKKYFLPAIFGRFYTVQIERFTKSIQKEFDEIVKQNSYFNEKINQTFQGAMRELDDYDDLEYVDSIKKSITEQRKFAEKIQERMHTKFEEKLKVIQNYGTKDFRDIYEYKVHLYAYSLSASDKVNSAFPQLKDQQVMKASMNSTPTGQDSKVNSFTADVKLTGTNTEASKMKQLSNDNLIIEPVASIQLAKFYSIEDQDNGLMFHKNLCDSFKVNEKQGILYILMQEKKKELFANQEGNIIKFVTRKLNYDQTELQNIDDFMHATNPIIHDDLLELRNLKYKVLTYGSNSLNTTDQNYHDKFFMSFREKDIMNNCQMFSVPKQLSEFVDKKQMEEEALLSDDKRNISEIKLLENQLLVTAKFLNPTKIVYEFRMLRNFKKLFEQEIKYKDLNTNDHGFERIQAFSEVKNVSKIVDGHKVDTEITINVVDKQMINQYKISFQKMDNMSLNYVTHDHQISYKNKLEGMDFTGKLVYDQQKYETYLISNDIDFNQDINQDIRQRFRVQKLHTKESFEKQKHQKLAQLDQSGQSIYLDHDMVLVNVASQTQIDLDQLKIDEENHQSFEELEELCSTNRLRYKFPQIKRQLLQIALNKWLAQQDFLKLRKAINLSNRGQDSSNIEEKIYINSVDLSSDHSYLIVSIHIVEFQNGKAKRAHVNRDIIVSLQDLRSVTENQNPGFMTRPIFKDEIEPLVPINPDKYPKRDRNLDHVKRKALEVQQNISLKNQINIKEVQEFEIYQEETINPDDLDQRLLKYIKKTIDLFEYVNKIQILQFQENWKPANPHMLDKLRIVNLANQEYTQFEKTVSFKNLTILVIVDEKYIVSIRQTVISNKRRDLVFEVKYYCPVYSDKLINKVRCNDPYDPDSSPEFDECQALQVKDLYDSLEFYSQVRDFENQFEMPDSRFQKDVQKFFGAYEDKAHVALKVLDRLSRQEKVFFAKIDSKQKNLEVYTTELTVLDLFNMDLLDGQLLPLRQILCIDAEKYENNVIDLNVNFQNKSITVILTLKSGYIDLLEVIHVEDKIIQPINQYKLVQSSSICLYQMQNNNIHSQINSHEDYSQNLQFLKVSNILRNENPNYMPEMFAQIPQDRKLVIYLIMLDEQRNKNLASWEKPKLKYFALEVDMNNLNKNLSCSARHYKVRNFVLTHQNSYGLIYGCKDEPVMLQQNPFSQEMITVIGARLSMVDLSKELMFQEASKVMNHVRMQEYLNVRTQTSYFSEREKHKICTEMHFSMRNMKRNIMLGDQIMYLTGFNQKSATQALLAEFYPQEFLFGKVKLSMQLDQPDKVSKILNTISNQPQNEQIEIIKKLCLMKDCNLGTLIESCITNHDNIIFRIILSKFMANHGSFKSIQDQQAIKALQILFNELSPFILQNQELADLVINQKLFRFGVFSVKMESEDHQCVWNDEDTISRYPNQNIPEDNILTIEDFKFTAKQKNVTDALPRDYSQIFQALREKLFNQRSALAKTSGFVRKFKCSKLCLRQGKTSSDASNLGSKDFPCFLHQYHMIDFKLVEYGYKRLHKVHERKEFRDYQPIYNQNTKIQRQAKMAKEAQKKKIQDAINWVKSLREESKEERIQRLKKEAEIKKKEQEALERGEDADGEKNEVLYEDWQPQTANQKLAASLPYYIEQFSEKKVLDMMTFQISDFLSGHTHQARLNESMETEASQLLYSKDIEAFVLHQWKAKSARLEVFRHIFMVTCFFIPFIIDSYSRFNSYEMLDVNIDYSNYPISDSEAESIQFGLKGVCIFSTLSLLVFEFVKAAASDRNKYSSIFSSQSHDSLDDRASAINVSPFNIMLFVIFLSWSVSSVKSAESIQQFKRDMLNESKSIYDLELTANEINVNQQILQFLHILLLVFSFVMMLDMMQMFSKQIHRTIEILKYNFKRFSSLMLIYILFNIVIGVSSKWNSQISTGFGEEVDTSKEGFVTASWEEIGSFYKTIRIFVGGMVFEFLNYTNDRTQFQKYWVISAYQVLVQVLIVIFVVAMFFTFVETAIYPRSLKHDKYDIKFIVDKNLQNLEFQEIENMLFYADKWIRLTYRRSKLVTSLINRIKRAWRKFMGELGFEEKIPLQRLKTDNSKYLVFNFRN